MKLLLIMNLILSFNFYAIDLDTNDEQSLFELAFGASEKPEKIFYTLKIANKLFFEVEIIKKEDVLIKEFNKIKEVLKETYKKEILDKLPMKQIFSIDDLRSYGININLNESDLTLEFIPEIHQRKIAISDGINSNFEEVSRKNSFSIYTNHYHQYNLNNKIYNYSGDFGINYDLFSVSGVYQKSLGDDLDLNDLSLTKDFRKSGLRIEVGDIEHGIQGFVNAQRGGGITLKKENSLRPNFITRKINEYSFYLKENAWVKVLINNKTYQKKHFFAGEHRIEGFSLPNGVNNLVLEIEYDSGKKELKEMDLGFNYKLLKKGFSEYQFSLFEDNFSLSLSEENKKKKNEFRGFTSYGLYDDLTISAEIALNENGFKIGSSFFTSTSIGNFDGAFGISKKNKSSHSGRLNWFYQNHKSHESFFKALSLGATYYSKNYLKSLGGEYLEDDQLQVDASGFFKLNKKMNLDLSFQKDFKENYQKINLGLNKRWSSSIFTDLDFTHEKKNNIDDFTISLRMNFNPVSKPLEMIAEANSKEQYSINTNLQSKTSFPGYQIDLDLNKDKDFESINLAGAYDHSRFISDIDLSRNNFSDDVNINGGIGHSIAYADGKVAFSRPIHGSFNIFSLENFEAGRKLKINPDGQGGYLAQAGKIPVAISNLTAYKGHHFEIDNFDLKSGEEVENSSVYHVPKYKSGSSIVLSRKSSFIVKAKINYREKELDTVVLDVLNESGESVLQAFTDESGVVFLEGLTDGEYIMDFGDYAPQTKIKIKGNGSEILDLGLINIQ